MIAGLLDTLAAHGGKDTVVPIFRAVDIKKDLLGLINGAFHTSWIDRIANYMTQDANGFIPSDMDFMPRSLISVVMPSPKATLQFHYRGKQRNCVLPPHYINFDFNNRRTLQSITGFLTPLGFSAAAAPFFPHKLLAVHCGLGAYGRNNICYNDKFGSYTQIMTYASDLPCEEAAWFPLSRMKRCNKCRVCATSCPTGAIDAGRRLVDADRCITSVNERRGKFPHWLKEDAHNSIVGCTKCQDSCPANAHNKDNVVVSERAFTEEETAELLNHKGNIPSAGPLSARLAEAGISPEYIDISVLSRNLAVLIQDDRL